MKYFIALCSSLAKITQSIYDSIFEMKKNIAEPVFLHSISNKPLLRISKDGFLVKTDDQKKREIEATMFSFDQLAHKDYLFSILNGDKNDQITEKDLCKYLIIAKNILKENYWKKYSNNLTKTIKEELTQEEREKLILLIGKNSKV